MRLIGSAWLHPTATVTGRVILGQGTNLWPQVVVRGDLAEIRIGANVNLQDGVIVHTDFGVDMDIENDVAVGHRAVLHGTSIGRGTLIGMGAILLSGSVIGEECIVAAGSLVTEGKVFPARSLIMGSPAKVVREVTEEQLERVRMICTRYRDLAADYAAGRIRAFGSDINKETWEAAL